MLTHRSRAAIPRETFRTLAQPWQDSGHESRIVRHVADTLAYTQLAPPLLHSPRVAPGLSLIRRRVLEARSLTETLTEAARAAVEVSHWERDQEAWNLPRAQGGTIARGPGKDEPDAGESDLGVQGEDPPSISPETTE